MGDLLNNSEILKKLGFDSSNQWILYDENFSKFFHFLAENITDANILTEQELLESHEILERGEWLEETELRLKMYQLESENPGQLTYTEQDIDDISEEIELIENETEEYNSLIEDMRNTKRSINSNLIELEHTITALHNAEKELLLECQNKAKQLEEMQRENSKLSADATKYFTKIQLPPLFMHQLPLDQYLLKCDSFMQHFTLYMKSNFKIQDFTDFECVNDNSIDISCQLENLEKSICRYTLAYLKEKAEAKATQELIDHLDLSHIHCISLPDMIRETHEIKLLNDHHLQDTFDTLSSDLPTYVQQHTSQRMELLLYENTKLKLDRALRRHESDKHLTKIISEALSNAELVWIAIQLDMEKKRNRFDATDELNSKAQSSWHRVQLMRSLNATYHVGSAYFLDEIAMVLGQHLSTNVRREAKACLYEYEKFGRLLAYAEHNMLSGKSYANAMTQINELKHLEKMLSPFVYDSPLLKPMFENVRYLLPIFNAKLQQHHIEKSLRNLRTQFQEEIIDRKDRDKLWRYGQLLWIWFLTDPHRMLHAINEVKKASTKIPSLAGIKTLGGIKRK